MEGAKYTNAAGGVVVNTDTGDVLVVNQNHNSWSLPKGHIESDENPLETAKREIFEESGISELNLISELGKYKRFRIGKYSKDDESEIKTILLYLFTTTQRHLNPTDPANPEAQWVNRFEVSKLLTHKKDKEFFESILSELPPIPEDNG